MKRTFPCMTETEYARTFSALRSTGEPEGIDEHRKMLNMMSGVISSFESGDPLDLLSIGPGDGKLENDLQVESGLVLGNYVAYEPNARHYKSLEKFMSKWKLTSYKLFKEAFGVDTVIPELKFDMVLMSHVLYYMADPEAVIMKAMSCLKPGGKLVIFIQEKCNPVGLVLYERFLEVAELDGKLYKDVANQLYNDRPVCEILQNNKKPYSWNFMEAKMDLTKVIEQTNYDRISFVLQTLFDKLPYDIQERLLSFLKEHCELNSENKWIISNSSVLIVACNN